MVGMQPIEFNITNQLNETIGDSINIDQQMDNITLVTLPKTMIPPKQLVTMETQASQMITTHSC